jgi:uncharacterized protein HemX
MRTLSKLTISALALSMGLAGWAVHEQRQKNKLERNKQRVQQEVAHQETGKVSEKEASSAQ